MMPALKRKPLYDIPGTYAWNVLAHFDLLDEAEAAGKPATEAIPYPPPEPAQADRIVSLSDFRRAK
ncbi:MAG: hypothetical protein LBL48_06900 [Azoarcus sp.]|jgi:hypothetical protein|nr:hypothetical protein [Azoarcus sp.]